MDTDKSVHDTGRFLTYNPHKRTVYPQMIRIKDVQNKTDIDIIQEKTGNILHLPLIRKVKSAIEDYLSVRPSAKSDLIFINVYATYNPVTTSTIRAALRKYIKLAKVEPGKRKSGPHALRSSLASSMVNENISYETVRKVLGHICIINMNLL